MCALDPSDPCVSALKVVGVVPSPQSTETDQPLAPPSFAPASLKEPRPKAPLEPSLAVWSAGAVTTGGALLTVIVVLYCVLPPSLSMIRPVTTYEPLSP